MSSVPLQSASRSTLPTLLSTGDVAEILATSTRNVRAIAASGELPKIRLGNRATRYRLSDVEDFIARRTSTGAPDNSDAAEANRGVAELPGGRDHGARLA